MYAYIDNLCNLWPRSASAPASHSGPTWRVRNCVGIYGQEHVKRALEVAAAGGHNVLMSGPPLPLVAGKTLLARSMPSILPRITPTEALDVTRIYSVAGTAQRARRRAVDPPPPLPPRRTTPSRTRAWWAAGSGRGPARSAWRTAGCSSWMRCRSSASTGWRCCASRWRTGRSPSAAAQGSLTFPANFMLVGAQNPCPCGYYGDPEHACTCSPMLISRYHAARATLRPAAGPHTGTCAVYRPGTWFTGASAGATDLAGSERHQPAHVAEAIRVRKGATDGVGRGTTQASGK